MVGYAKRAERSTNIWPGFVDALATLLMVMMFLLLIFVLAQFFLGQALSGRDQALENLRGQVSELADLLSLERKANQDIRQNLAQLSQELQVSVALRDDLKTTVSQLRRQDLANKEEITSLMSSLAAADNRITDLQKETTGLKGELTGAEEMIAKMSADAETMRTSLAAAEEKLRQQLAELSGLNRDIAALQALKSELEGKISELAGKLETKNDELAGSKKALLEEKDLSKSARAEIALLNQQTAALREQMAQIQAALDASEKLSEEQKVQIVSLGKRLNAALASKVQELSRYRSEFFGRLRDLMGGRQDVRIVGDRFVFQSEVLFEKGSADLEDQGKGQLNQLALTLLEIAVEIPGEIDWVLRIDGHTDNDPISTARFPSNWELSTARAISVLKHLVEAGLPANRLVAAGFGEFHPLDLRDDEFGKRRNRRIEMKLTQR